MISPSPTGEGNPVARTREHCQMGQSWYRAGTAATALYCWPQPSLLSLCPPHSPPRPRHPRWRSRAILERGHSRAEINYVHISYEPASSYVTWCFSPLLSRDRSRPFPHRSSPRVPWNELDGKSARATGTLFTPLSNRRASTKNLDKLALNTRRDSIDLSLNCLLLECKRGSRSEFGVSRATGRKFFALFFFVVTTRWPNRACTLPAHSAKHPRSLYCQRWMLIIYRKRATRCANSRWLFVLFFFFFFNSTPLFLFSFPSSLRRSLLVFCDMRR